MTIGRQDFRFETQESSSSGSIPTDMSLEQVERWYIERVLREESGHVDSASRRLGIPRSTLYQKLKKWDVPTSRF